MFSVYACHTRSAAARLGCLTGGRTITLSKKSYGNLASRLEDSTMSNHPFSQLAALMKASPTPLVKIWRNLHAKLEGAHTTGSIKDRAVSRCVTGMLMNGSLRPGRTLALCTSGSAGVALLHVQEQLRKQGIMFHVKIFMPATYVAKNMKIVQTPGVVTEEPGMVTELDDKVYSRQLCPHTGDFVTTLGRMKELAAKYDWAILDQHYDVNNMLSHESTATELLEQLPSLTDVVCATGTGGTAAGLRAFLPAHVKVHARPAVSGTVDGCTDVRRYDNFCDPELLAGYSAGFYDPDEARVHQKELQELHQIEGGTSSGATYALAKQLVKTNPNASVAFICADGKSTTGLAQRVHMSSSLQSSGFARTGMQQTGGFFVRNTFAPIGRHMGTLSSNDSE